MPFPLWHALAGHEVIDKHPEVIALLANPANTSFVAGFAPGAA
jgi:hypothetical protein